MPNNLQAFKETYRVPNKFQHFIEPSPIVINLHSPRNSKIQVLNKEQGKSMIILITDLKHQTS